MFAEAFSRLDPEAVGPHDFLPRARAEFLDRVDDSEGAIYSLTEALAKANVMLRRLEVRGRLIDEPSPTALSGVSQASASALAEL
jgi:hypothetical protein